MLRYALPLLSSLHLGQRLKSSVRVYVHKAIVVAVALLLLIAAAAFALVAGYHAMVGHGGLAPITAAGILAAGLLLASVLVMAILPLIGRRAQRTVSSYTPADAGVRAVGMVDQQVGRVMQQLGPVGVLAFAFAIGLLAGRR